MAQHADLEPFSLRNAVSVDCGLYVLDCFVLDVGRNENGREIKSLERVADIVGYHLKDAAELAPIKKLYILGSWRLTPSEAEREGSEEPELKRVEGEPHVFTKAEKEWHDAGKLIAKFVALIPGLEELTWLTNLPFTAHVWEGLTTSLSKLVLDIGNPVRLQVDSSWAVHKSYLTASELGPLTQQTKLKELRLFCMQDSHQLVIWETVYRNTSSGGMRLLELSMAAPPLVRSEHWKMANDVTGLTVASNENGKEYKGIDGKGILHYSFGTGEYLDNLCMRKARIAAKLTEAGPLPLVCLKLNGFVVDHLPFEEEFKDLVLLTCDPECIDAGIRPPLVRTAPHNRQPFSNESRCFISWPNWFGVLYSNSDDQTGDNGSAALPDWVVMLPAPEYPTPEAAAAAAAKKKEKKEVAAAEKKRKQEATAALAAKLDSKLETMQGDGTSLNSFYYLNMLEFRLSLEDSEDEDEDAGYFGDASENGDERRGGFTDSEEATNDGESLAPGNSDDEWEEEEDSE